jgi:hypothetical protein
MNVLVGREPALHARALLTADVPLLSGSASEAAAGDTPTTASARMSCLSRALAGAVGRTKGRSRSASSACAGASSSASSSSPSARSADGARKLGRAKSLDKNVRRAAYRKRCCGRERRAAVRAAEATMQVWKMRGCTGGDYAASE